MTLHKLSRCSATKSLAVIPMLLLLSTNTYEHYYFICSSRARTARICEAESMYCCAVGSFAGSDVCCRPSLSVWRLAVCNTIIIASAWWAIAPWPRCSANYGRRALSLFWHFYALCVGMQAHRKTECGVCVFGDTGILNFVIEASWGGRWNVCCVVATAFEWWL